MKSHLVIFLSLFFLFTTIQCRYRETYPKRFTSPPQTIHKMTQQTYTFDQIVDHSNYQTSTYYKQRYHVYNTYFAPKSGPVYLYLCGEWICDGIRDTRQWIFTLAQKTMGLVIVLEHRFYGQSLPFGNDTFKIENMKLLTSEQALSDAAYFLRTIKVNQMHGVSNNPWVTVGGSYPGALSAWFRYKYPHLTIGSIASSAVVQAIEIYSDFDLQMYLSAKKSGDDCVKAINESNTRVERILDSTDGQNFKKQFEGGDKLKDDEFMFFWIDAIVMQIQYGQRTTFCETLKNLTSENQFNYLVSEAKKHQVYEYGSYYLKNDTIPPALTDVFFYLNQSGFDRLTARAWYYQSCTQFGFWQTPSSYPMRSKRLGIDFYKRFCTDAYGNGTWPKTDRKNIETGGWDLEGSKIFMVNGDEDPWKWASILKDKGDIIAREALCDDCAHVPEFYTPRIDDPPELKKIRDEQYLTVQEWIDEYWRTQSHKTITKQPKIKVVSQ